MLPQPLNGLWQHPHWAASRPHWHRSDEDSRAISGPLTPVTSGVSRSVADTPPRKSGGVAPGRHRSQADSAGSNPVTRSDDEGPGRKRSAV